ncbi:MAG TPA: dihydroorotate dehydrogenase [Candidatus Limnocylindrales bacterium]|nr:dihydroorotate dehydrogenase [Candidatus Limnocylindrales bacterium]
MSERTLSVDLGRGLRLRTPVLVASGTFAYGFDAPLIDRARLGAIVTKGTTLRARDGNPPTRIAETPSGMLNAIGLQNPGVAVVRREYAPRWAQWDLPVIVNVAGDRVDDYVEVARRLDGVPGVAGLELNISCPNVAAGLQFGLDARLAAEVTGAVRRATALHLMVKLTPNVTNLAAIASAIADAGADSLSAVNTFVGMAIDVRRRRPVLANVTGGLSGPAIRPLALRAVWEVAATVRIPVIGIGGIASASDALEFLLAGAAAVQLGTVNYVNPRAVAEVVEGIEQYAADHGFADLSAFPLRPSVVPSHA